MLAAESKVLPPEWTDKLTGATPAAGAAVRKNGGRSDRRQRRRPACGCARVAACSMRPASARAAQRPRRVAGAAASTSCGCAAAPIPRRPSRVRSDDLALTRAGPALRRPSAMQPGRIELQAGPTIATLRWSRLELQGGAPACRRACGSATAGRCRSRARSDRRGAAAGAFPARLRLGRRPAHRWALHGSQHPGPACRHRDRAARRRPVGDR